jgi:hypothetical protein
MTEPTVADRDPLESLREAIESFGAERAAELVAEARAEATARVRSMLAEAMAESLLAHSAAELRPPAARTRARPSPKRRSARARTSSPRQTPKRSAPTPRSASTSQPRPEPTPGEEELGCYVYGVVSSGGADLPADLAGVDSRYPVALVENEGLAAIVSRVSLAEFGEERLRENLNDVEWLEDKARAHEEVLEAALARMTVVPMRLCTIYRGEEQVHEMLAGERAVLHDALERLEGKAEWGVKLIAEPEALHRAASRRATPEEEPRGVSEGVDYLNRKRREAATRDDENRVAEEWSQTVHDRLAAAATEALLNPLQRPEVSGHVGEMLLNGVYLVDDRELEDFREQADRLAAEFRELGAAVEVTGPWPAYNFVHSSIEAAR